MKKSQSFLIRSVEHHHSLNLDPDETSTHEHIHSVLDRMGEMGFNQILLGEKWPLGLNRLLSHAFDSLLERNIDQEAVKRRKEVFGEISRHASNLGIQIHAIYHPISFPESFLDHYPETAAVEPPGWERQLAKRPLPRTLCPHHEKVQETLSKQVSEILMIPGVSGISCWLNQSPSRIFDCSCEKCKNESLDELMTHLSRILNSSCLEAKGQLSIRTYLGSWQCGLEEKFSTSLHSSISKDIRLIYKQQQGDMYNLHPFNPLIGKLEGRPQAIEFDTYGEYRGYSLGIVGSVRHQLKEGVQLSEEHEVEGVVIRGIHAEHPFSVDEDCLSALLDNPEVDVDMVALRTLDEFGDAAPDVLKVLDDSWEVWRRCTYIRGVYWASWSIPPGLDRLRFILYDRSAPCVPGAFKLLEMNEELISECIGQLNQALRLAESLSATVARAGTSLSDEDSASLHASAQSCLCFAKVCRNLVPTFLKFFRWESTPGATMREYLRIDLIKDLDHTETELGQIESDIRLVDCSAISRIMEAAGISRAKVGSAIHQPVVHARKICLDIRSLIDRPASSFTGISPWPNRWPKGVMMRDFGGGY